MVTSIATQFTRADYERLPEGFPAELIRGRLVKEPSPIPWHQVIVRRVARVLEDAAGAERILFSPVDVFVDDHNVLQPDVLVLREGHTVRPTDREVPIPLLVVEVLSPSTAARDRNVKTRIYLGAGVEEVWLVDPRSGTVELRTASGSKKTPAEDVLESTAVPGFSISPHDLR